MNRVKLYCSRNEQYYHPIMIENVYISSVSAYRINEKRPYNSVDILYHKKSCENETEVCYQHNFAQTSYC